MTPRMRLKTSEARKRNSGLPSSPALATTSLVIEPKMLSGEKPPAVAPLITIRPINSCLMSYLRAKVMPIGAMIATAAGTTAPMPVRTAVTPKNTHGIRATRPPTERTAAWTSQSTVPLFLAMPKRNVTPARVMNRSPGKPSAIAPDFSSSASGLNPPGNSKMPRTNAAEMASAPMWIGRRVAIRKITARTRSEMMATASRDKGRTFRWVTAGVGAPSAHFRNAECDAGHRACKHASSRASTAIAAHSPLRLDFTSRMFLSLSHRAVA